MRILVSNDDGVYAPGISALVKELSKSHEVVVSAPETEQSGVSHCLTFLEPVVARRIDDMYGCECYAVRGTPADCVKLAVCNLLSFKPDFVISGINNGSNLGSDVHYSGTAAAAMEGVMNFIPSIAVSLCVRSYDHSPDKHYETAAKYALWAVDFIAKNPLPPFTMFNVNVPDETMENIKGIRAASLAIKHYAKNYSEYTSPRGKNYYFLPKNILDRGEWAAESDEVMSDMGYVTVTPVKCDSTDYALLEKYRSGFSGGGDGKQ